MQEYLLILRRRRAIILQAFVLITVVGIVVTLMTRPVYQASAKMLIEGPSLNMNTVDTQNPLSALFMLNQQQSVATQIEVLQAGPLMAEAAKQAGPALLKVAQDGDTNIIEVDAEAGDPKVAANAPNALLDLYVNQMSDTAVNDMASAHQFIADQETQARKQLTASEQALKDFKLKNHVTDFLASRTEQAQRVATLTTDAQGLQTQMASLQAQAAAINQQLAQEPATKLVTVKATNAHLASLRDQINQLEIERVGMMQPGGFTAQAPQVRNLDARVAALKQQLAQQPPMTASASAGPNANHDALHTKAADLQVQKATLDAQLVSVNARLNMARAAAAKLPDWEITYTHLNATHDTAAAAEKMFSQQLNDLNLREKARHPNARVIEQAVVPVSPVRPKKLQGILFSCLIGLFIGMCLALLQEFLDDRINTAEDADRTLGLPNLGRVPALTAADARLLPQMKGMDPASEAYRILRTNIHFASVDAPTKTLVVTSSRPGEGKSTTASNLAFAMALDGRRVIIVDSDLRRPSLHKLLGLPTVPGLTDVLLGDTTLDDALLEHSEMPGLYALSCGSTPPNPSELLGSRRFRSLVGELQQRADIVIFDSPPVLAAADSQILASQMSGVVLVIEAGETRKAEARQTVALLRQAHANILGAVYNKAAVLGGPGYYYYGYHVAPRLEAPEEGVNATSAFRPLPAAEAPGVPLVKPVPADEGGRLAPAVARPEGREEEQS